MTGYRLRLVALIILFTGLIACARQYSVTVNQQTLYDPRPRNPAVHLTDPGLQACVDLSMRQQEVESPENIIVLSCPGLEITTLAGIGALRRLQFLDVRDNELVHLDELRGMRMLSSVNAPNNPLNDISALLSIPTLNSALLSGSTDIPCSQLDALAERLGQNLTRPGQCRR